MSTAQLIENYSYAVDTMSVICCIVLLMLVRWVLYFSIDRKFCFVKRALHFIMIGAVSNVLFALICENRPDAFVTLYILRDIYHVAIMCVMYIFILYIYHLLDVKNRVSRSVAYFTRTFFCVMVILDLLSPITHFGFRKEGDLWYDPIISPYNIFYIYMLVLMMLMLVNYSDRLVKSVRFCLIATEVIICIIMSLAGLQNSNTYTTFTYLLPIVVVLILLHSKPYDDLTGAMSSRSFDSYVQKAVENKTILDYTVLYLDKGLEKEIPTEVGKLLSTFWHPFFKMANFFQIETNVYVLVIPRIKKNGNTVEKIRKLFYEEFPKQYSKYQLKYKILGIYALDYVTSSTQVRDIIHYLFMLTEDNGVLEVDDKLSDKLKVMRNVREHLIDIEKKNNPDDERVLVYCQPITNTVTGKFDTAEALMRLSLPGNSFITPDLFIPLAEYYGHIHALSLIILNKVCKSIRQFDEEGYHISRISVNFAISELLDDRFCDDILYIIKANKVDPSRIGIELTESQNESDFNIIKERITFLKSQGMTIYLDDFGTGYSNLDRILKLGLDVIKYDRSMLLVAEEKNASYLLIHFAQAFKQLDYKLLFEGVENTSHEELCLSAGADYLQGFMYSKPIPIEELPNFLNKE